MMSYLLEHRAKMAAVSIRSRREKKHLIVFHLTNIIFHINTG